MKQKALSQVVSTILLIALVVTMAGIIIFWSKGITGEAITIYGQNIELVCYDVFFEFSYDNGVLNIINSGNVDIYSIELIIHTEDNSEAVDIKDLTSKWPEDGLTQGGIFSESVSFNIDVKEVHLFPILRGNTESGKQKEHLCEHESQIIEVN